MQVAVVEDDAQYRDTLRTYIERFAGEEKLSLAVTVFEDGRALLESGSLDYDIILLDIEMPHYNGMEVAEQIRRRDSELVLMFVTNMAQYAIRGYEVGALDFVLKPINYYSFSLRFARAVERARRREGAQLLLNLPDSVRRLEIAQIYYVEVQNRMLHYHTAEGEFVLRGTMQAAEKELSGHAFVRCNHWYLVNLRHVTEIRRDVAVVAGALLEISRRNRTAFLAALTNYVGGNH